MNDSNNIPATTIHASKLSTSKKAKALLIALLNLNLIFLFVVFKSVDVQIAGQMITAVLFLASLYLGGQSALDVAATWNTNASTTKNKTETINKNYNYQMQYVDEKK